MAQSKSSSNKPSRLSLSGKRFLMHPALLPVVVFSVIVGFIGAHYLGTSDAASSACVSHTYSTAYRNVHEACVADIQSTLDQTNNYMRAHSGIAKYKGSNIAADGYYGSLTAGQVRVLQGSVFFSKYAKGVDGVVGPNTWGALCYAAYNYGSASTNNYGRMGCHSHNGAAQY
jgi:hypothetical protein